MFIVLRRKSVLRTVAIASLLIFIGLSFSLPARAAANVPELFYLYPTLSNNPVDPNGYFWSEKYPELGAFPLGYWLDGLKDKTFVVAIPEHYEASPHIVGDNLGKYVVAKIKKRFNGNNNSGKHDKDIIVYKRNISDNGVVEEIRIEIGKHFKDNDNFDHFVNTIKENLITDPKDIQIIKEIPDKKENPDMSGAEQALIFGNTMVLGGLALLVRLLVFKVPI